MSHQQPGPSISDFIVHLKKISKHFELEDTLENMIRGQIRGQIVVGVADDRIGRRLLSERKLTFANALDIPLALEGANKKHEWHWTLCNGYNTQPITKKCQPGETTTQFRRLKSKQKSCFRRNAKPSLPQKTVIFPQPVWLWKTREKKRKQEKSQDSKRRSSRWSCRMWTYTRYNIIICFVYFKVLFD